MRQHVFQSLVQCMEDNGGLNLLQIFSTASNFNFRQTQLIFFFLLLIIQACKQGENFLYFINAQIKPAPSFFDFVKPKGCFTIHKMSAQFNLTYGRRCLSKMNKIVTEMHYAMPSNPLLEVLTIIQSNPQMGMTRRWFSKELFIFGSNSMVMVLQYICSHASPLRHWLALSV